MYSSGLNQYGQLGLGDTENRNTLTKVSLVFVAADVVSFEDCCHSALVLTLIFVCRYLFSTG